MPFGKYSKPSWLIFFLGSGYDKDLLENNITKLSELSKKTPCPYTIAIYKWASDQIYNLLSKVRTRGEMVDVMDMVINNIIKVKKAKNLRNAEIAIILNLKVFGGNPLALDEFVKNEYFYNVHLMCFCEDFSILTQDARCFRNRCTNCGKHLEVAHSCLPKLLWLLFNKDDAVIPYIPRL